MCGHFGQRRPCGVPASHRARLCTCLVSPWRSLRHTPLEGMSTMTNCIARHRHCSGVRLAGRQRVAHIPRATVPFADVATLGDAINYIADGLAAVSPGPLGPIVDTLGADLASLISFEPAPSAVARLVVRPLSLLLCQ